MAARGQQLIATFKKFPIELFRNNRNGSDVRLRSQSPGRRIYDIVAYYGRVKPKALNAPTYTGLLKLPTCETVVLLADSIQSSKWCFDAAQLTPPAHPC